MEQKEAEQIIFKKFEAEKAKSVLTYRELADALGMKPKDAKKYLCQMVDDGLLAQHNAGAIYYERAVAS